MNKTIGRIGIILLVLSASAGIKIWLLQAGVVPFNSDEAVVALMARHITVGERPFFFYGQVYMGSLDAFLVAIGFVIWGQAVWVIRLVQAMLYSLTIITTVWIGKVAFQSFKTGILAACLLAIPAVNVTLYTTASLGGYGEALLIGNLILLVGLILLHKIQGDESIHAWPTMLLIFVFGFLTGFGLWANGLTLVYSAPVIFILMISIAKNWRAIRVAGLAILVVSGSAGFICGSAPWWIFALTSGWGNLVRELTGSAVAVESGSWLVKIISHLVNLILFGTTVLLGFRPPWDVRWLALPLLPFVLIFWISVLLFTARKLLQKKSGDFTYWLLSSVPLTLCAGFIFTSFGVDPSGRYFLPMTVPLALLAAKMVQSVTPRTVYQFALLGVVLCYHLWGTWQCASTYPPGITTQFYAFSIIDHRYDSDLIQFLDTEGEYQGYTNYWVAYPLAFLSQEKLIYIPRLPYHPDLRYTPRDDRYPPYDQIVATSKKAAYITTNNPALDNSLVSGLKKAGITYSEKWIGDYHIYYHLSRDIHPDELLLGDFAP
ncbi:hypothetical protein IMZ68_00035 [Candidatus Bathyarchaeota archaeon]|nr:hypothetical protein [Candidatus Bathyarchaeota archaeon]